MGSIGCPERSVRNYYYSLRNNREKISSQLLRGGSLKSHISRNTLLVMLGVLIHYSL